LVLLVIFSQIVEVPNFVNGLNTIATKWGKNNDVEIIEEEQYDTKITERGTAKIDKNAFKTLNKELSHIFTILSKRFLYKRKICIIQCFNIFLNNFYFIK